MKWWVRLSALGAVAAAGLCSPANKPGMSWTRVRTSHFDIYSEAGGDTAKAMLRWFEQLRVFFEQSGVKLDNRGSVRVIGFSSVQEYNAYRLRPTADAYYVGTEGRDYIVMPTLAKKEFAVAAHEYAHLVLRASGMRFPPWLSEGLAEYFSTVRIEARGSTVGGPIAGHLQTLRRRGWMPLAQLIALTAEERHMEDREEATLFYAQSWALVDLLLESREYRPDFPELLAVLGSGAASGQALTNVYGRPLGAIGADMRAWGHTAKIGRKTAPVTLPGVALANFDVQQTELSAAASRALLAEVLLAAGELDRAAELYRDILQEAPGDADALGALGTIALLRGDREAARQQWKQAIAAGVTDATLCYRYALLAEDLGVPASEVRSALEHAVALNPDFDDARYRLALLESNAGDYEAAVSQFRAMKSVAPARAYAYWSGVAYSLGELGRRDEAKIAADQAMKYASTAAERAHATELAYTAETDLAVQFTRDGDGQPRLVTTRVAHGSLDWNPFIEPGETVRRKEGKLREVQCGGGKVTGVEVDTTEGSLQLAIPDRVHVLMRNAPSEFTCGPQTPVTVRVEYAASQKGAGEMGCCAGWSFDRCKGMIL